MIKQIKWSALLLASLCLSLSSCSDNDEPTIPAPVVNITELGSNHDNPNNNTATIGTDLHINAEIFAEGLIREIHVEIHGERGINYEIEKAFTGKYVGVKNTTFHEHIDIPADAPAGEYHFHLIVVDQLGQTTMADADLILE
jgi:hypothetical protein